MRVGIGYDIHALVEGRKLIIGGVHVPYERGCMGHSDADPLLHAVIDAMLGAAGLESAEDVFIEIVRDVRVRRGDEPRILRESLPLVLPAGARPEPEAQA